MICQTCEVPVTHIPECWPDFVIAASEEELGPNESIVSLSNLDDFICGGEGVTRAH